MMAVSRARSDLTGQCSCSTGKSRARRDEASLAAIPAAIIGWIVIAVAWIVQALVFGSGFWPRSAW
jgi:hypothetical protein